MKMTLRTVALATSTVVCATLWSVGWSEQGGVSVSVTKAEAQKARVVIRTGGIGCTPGTAIQGGDGIMYNCQ
jgi:hypothetical protein